MRSGKNRLLTWDRPSGGDLSTHGNGPVIIVPKRDVPQDILKDSVLAHVAAAYFSVGKRLERKTKCSATRGFILSTLRGGVALNQNQIATLLGFDRTVVHRAIKSMVQEGLLSERKAKSGRTIHVNLTPKGRKYRKRLINTRIAADDKLRAELTPEERTTLRRLLKLIAELEF
ncbi:MAG TPA: MarR family winged helix-turn-helix transcriptional regulator [Candidatus Dormibacteraeota bacterium]|nr:MarR family winged helix-turn-helix transcriptional regulator [Candidatus Dormibacteraeota bacterium]